ncbi:hypothetical protein JRO89_XS13G0090300 [Xanthoceras sorbifolium]|uniref:Uncharacterized protein n=1 Tax=Xanthoceras sorbifolium TaxID=99658 RepID=A0ABQ8H7F7_9ROSI|nr:hypothetical protein JRO89_XS13G0090300 [Xanthoceras sorbifolium]
MLQYPAFMRQYPSSTRTIPASILLPSQWPQPHSEEFHLAMEESEFEDKMFSCDSLLLVSARLDVEEWLEEAEKGNLRDLYISQSENYCNEIRKTNSNLIVIGKTTVDNDKEDFDNDADDDDADHGDESEGEEFEQETS